MPMNTWEWVHFHHCADASHWYGDSFAWMRVAVREDAESGRVQQPGAMDHHRLNVALVSAGIAIELIYKVLLIADRVKTISEHNITKLHGLLEARKSHVEEILLTEGWESVEDYLRFMDERLRHADRRYWMSNPAKRKRGGQSFAIAIEPMTVPSLARVHKKMSTLVDIVRLVQEYNLEYSRVVITQALTRDPILSYRAMASRCLQRDGQKVEYTVYEAIGWHVPDYVRGWWEMPQASGEPTGKFVFLLNPGEYDETVAYWCGQPE